MTTLITILKLACLLGASMILGNWFLSEVKKAKIKKLPWYQPYMSIPGIIIIVAIMLPIIYWIIVRR